MSEQVRVRIVPMTAEHLDEVAKLEQICFPDPWSRNLLAEELKNDLCAYLVALDAQGLVAGYAGMQVILDEGTIQNIAVKPEYRRQGIAKQLLEVFINFSQANHLAFLTLEVRASNDAAIALYSGMGFRTVGRRRGYYDYPAEDALIMTRYFDRQSDSENMQNKAE